MIRGIQICYIDKGRDFPRGTYYIKNPNEITIGCTKGSFIITDKELEKFVKDREKEYGKKSTKD